MPVLYSGIQSIFKVTRHSSQTLQTFPPRQVKISGGSTDCETKP